MAWDVGGLRADAGRGAPEQARARDRLPALLQSALHGGQMRASSSAGLLGDVYHARLAWHRNGNWRRQGAAAERQLRSFAAGATRPTSTCSTGGSTRSIRAGCSPSSAATRSASRAGCSARRPRRCMRRAASTASRTGVRCADHVYGTFEYPGRPHGRLLVDRIERVRQLLRDVPRDEGHADPVGRAGSAAVRRRRRKAPARPSRWRRRPRARSGRRVHRDAAGQPAGRSAGVRGGRGASNSSGAPRPAWRSNGLPQASARASRSRAGRIVR